MINKKPYEAPIVLKVKLSLRDAILATCHSSPNMTPAEPDCAVAAACYNPPTP